jgi:hypothetical protein
LVASLHRQVIEALGIPVSTGSSFELDGVDLQSVQSQDPEFVNQVNEFIDEYCPALEALAKK